MKVLEMYVCTSFLGGQICKYCKYKQGCPDYNTLCFKFKYDWNDEYPQINGVEINAHNGFSIGRVM